MIVEFFVAGEPRPQGSKSGRVVWSKKKQRDVALLTDGFGESPRKLKLWRNLVRDAASAWRLDHTGYGAPLFDRYVPVDIYLVFFLQRPKSVKREYPVTKPDIDKLERAILDGLKGEIFFDDAQVIDVVKSKRYAPSGSPPGVKVSAFEKGTVLEL